MKIEMAVMILQHLQLGSPGQPCLSRVQKGWSSRAVSLGYTLSCFQEDFLLPL